MKTKSILIVQVGGEDYLERPTRAIIDLNKAIVEWLQAKMNMAARVSRDEGEDITVSAPDYSPDFTSDDAFVDALLTEDQQVELADGGHVAIKVNAGFELPEGKKARVDNCRLHASQKGVWWEMNEKHCFSELYTYSMYAADLKALEKVIGEDKP